MTFTQMHNRMMSHGTASSCAEAASSRAQSAQAFFNSIMLILGAIIVASIIIFGLVRLVSLGLNIALVGLILLAVLLVLVVVCSPEMRKRL